MRTAVYEYLFDKATVGDYRLACKDYEMLHGALKLLESKLEAWNTVAIQHGALEAPYQREVEDLARMIAWRQEELVPKLRTEIVVRGISVGSMRYQKAALIHGSWFYEEQVAQDAKDDWPSAVVEAMRGKARRLQELAAQIQHAPPILEELRPKSATRTVGATLEANWDVFISHTSEDKEAFARPLAEKLRQRGLQVWYDDFTLTVGDSLRRSIDRGLARSRFGVVILSPRFFAKEWPQKELEGLVAREVDGKKVILPIWHEIGAEGIRAYSPLLADRVAVSSAKGLAAVVDALTTAMRM